MLVSKIKVEVSSYKDKFGKEVRVGDYIVYGHNLGRCAGLRIGKVMKIMEMEEVRRYEGREILYKSNSISVIGIDDDWNGREPEILSKISTLQFRERTIKLDPDSIPENYMKIFLEYRGKK